MYRINPYIEYNRWMGDTRKWALEKSVKLFGYHIFWRTLDDFDTEEDALAELEYIVKTGMTTYEEFKLRESLRNTAHLASTKIYNEKGIQTWP